MNSDERLRGAYAALRDNRPEAALAALDALLAPAEQADALPPRDRARAHAWRAQAMRALGRAEEGAREVIAAIRLAKAEGDTDGVLALRALHAELSASVASLRTAEAGRAADRALLGADEAAMDAETLLRKSGACADAGEAAEAERTARLALSRAATPREQVLTRLALARLTRDPALVLASHTIADAADDQNLLTAVAHAARALAVQLPRPSFG